MMHRFCRVLLVSCIAIVAVPVAMFGEDQPSGDAIRLAKRALAAQGGEQALRALRSVKFTARGYRNALEQSERPDGPYFLEVNTISESRDLAGNRLARQTISEWPPDLTVKTQIVVANGVPMRESERGKTAGGAMDVEESVAALALGPERVLLTALAAPDLKIEPDTVLHAIPHHVLKFGFRSGTVRVFLNPYTLLPMAVEYDGPAARAGYWNFLGDATMTTEYSLWWLARDGIRYPLEWTTRRNGLPESSVRITQLKLNTNLDDAEFAIPASVRDQFSKRPASLDLEAVPFSVDQPVELASGVLLFPGSWNTTMIRQEDGVVVLEAPISSGYSAKVLEEAARRFPGLPIKAIITTSDSWPHLAGIREYVARGIPVYALDLNEPVLRRVITQSHASKPDALERAPRPPVLRFVSGKTTLGTGANRLELIPIRGATSERQMMVYFPEHRLLYGSDPFQKNEDGTYYYPQTVSELAAAVEREHLAVDRFFMMHMGLTLWGELAPVIAGAQQADTLGNSPGSK